MSELRAFLDRIPALAGVDHHTLDILSQEMHRRTYPAGQMLAQEDAPCQSVMLIARGIVRERHLSAEGREYILAYATPGHLLNLVAAFDEQGSLAALDALTDVEAWEIACSRFVDMVVEHPRLARATFELLGEKVRNMSIMARDLALYDVRTRLARFLLSNAENSPANQRWTQELIASHIGTVRDVVGRVLRSFEEQGMVRKERGRVIIVDVERLKAEAEGA